MRRNDLATWLLCVPVALGVSIMVSSQAPLARWGVQLAAGCFGFVVYLIVTKCTWRVPSVAAVASALALVCLVASTLAATGIDGVQRWHRVGPLLVHASALLTPALLVFAAREQARRPGVGHGLLWLVQVVHWVQPDAGQATALGVGGALLAGAGLPKRLGVPLACGYLLSAAATWIRHDPLPPAPFVEDIVLRAFELAPALGVVALLSLAGLVVAPLFGEYAESRPQGAAWALAGYFAGSVVAPCFGEFPVPLLGFGSSPLVGAFLGLAAFQRVEAGLAEAQSRPGAARRGAKSGGFGLWRSVVSK